METEQDVMMHQQSPAEALDSIRRTRSAVGERMNRVHWSYEAAYGLICGGMVAAIALPSPFRLAALAVLLCSLGGLVAWWQKSTGVWVNGLSPSRARWVAGGLGAFMAVAIVAATVLSRRYGLWQAPLVGGALVAVVSVLASRLWMRVYLSEIRGEI